MTEQATKRRRWLLAGILGVLLLGAVSQLEELMDNPLELSEAEVQVDCQAAVRRQLKAPSTADFVSSGPVQKVGAVRYRTTGSLDAENSFGVPLRSTYTCELSYRDGRWRPQVSIRTRN